MSALFKVVAEFFDKHYSTLNSYIKSNDCIKKRSVIQRLQFGMNRLETKQKSCKLTRDERKQLNMIKASCTEDQEQLDGYIRNRDQYLSFALLFYGKSIQWSDSSNLQIFRLVSLWLTNKNITKVCDDLSNNEILSSLQSYQFLNILPQLSAHLHDNPEENYVTKLIYEILKRCAKDHPHHVLNQLMALSNSYSDASSQTQPKDEEHRVLGAQRLLNELSNDENLKKKIDQLSEMTDVLIRFANTKLDKTNEVNGNKIKISSNSTFARLRNFDEVHCHTLDLKVRKDCNYSGHAVTIVRWDQQIEILAGVNEPKKLKCLCSDGVIRFQLLKGNDDLRQDAVMQQVFNIMNTMLSQNPMASRKRLQVKTYKVIPFSRRSGMLEWCSNTVPIGNVIRNCHKLYRPYDAMNPSNARDSMARCAGKDIKCKLQTYKEICEKLKPAFHYFFLSTFLVPGKWFERKLAYTNSIATNSIIGYILGIGDRHVMNILLDSTSAEVVHIDFGIAFEQGKSLPTPETIPFRLTRDFVAGMGVTGVEGIFRKSAELTLQVLHDNQSTILAILEVLLYDPLYLWALSPEKVRRTQSLEFDPSLDRNTNTSAERALENAKEKLNGENGDSSGYSTIESQVDRLIQQATCDSNLSRLFSGWQPYL